jgi:hypothetical protein
MSGMLKNFLSGIDPTMLITKEMMEGAGEMD